ncbi:MAG: hypothetical protein U5L75_00740 [Candidatus Campbellbacteria bacterium]|nr:hypothetical protein [Candidatus Campbellbacteria bacterium]
MKIMENPMILILGLVIMISLFEQMYLFWKQRVRPTLQKHYFTAKADVAAREKGHLTSKSHLPNLQKDFSTLKSTSAVVHKDVSTLKSVSAVVQTGISTLKSLSAVVRKYFSMLNSVSAVLQNYFSTSKCVFAAVRVYDQNLERHVGASAHLVRSIKKSFFSTAQIHKNLHKELTIFT